MEPSSQGTHSQVAPIPVSPAAFLLEIRRRRADLADTTRAQNGAPSNFSSFSTTPTPQIASGRPQSPSEEANVIRWLQRIDERLGSFGEHMSRVEALVSTNINALGTDTAAQDAIQKLNSDLQRQRAAYYQMLATSEAVVSKLMRENSDLKDRINFIDQDESSQQVRFCVYRTGWRSRFFARRTPLFSVEAPRFRPCAPIFPKLTNLFIGKIFRLNFCCAA
jgi:MFS superfamily sulfate permease-like transporter